MNIYQYNTQGNASETGQLMRQVVEKYYLDMAPYASLSVIEIYAAIKNLPYREDPEEIETLMRPYYTMNMRGYGGDCDDKAIAMASWARLRRMPYRFVAIRRPDRKELHHVALELYIRNQKGQGVWIFFDPTYRFNVYGRGREEAERVII